MLTSRDAHWLDMARKMAASSVENQKHGAVVVRNGKAVGRGINRTRNDNSIVSPEHIKASCSYHAEEVALRKAGKKSRNGVLYVARVSNNGEDRYSQPCSKCHAAIRDAGIKRVVYTITGECNDY